MELSEGSLEKLVKEWLRLDREEHTRKEIEGLWASQQISELETRLRPRIDFGTADKGRMGAGFAQMNSLVVIQASQGLAAYLINKIPNARSKGIVIGRDHRKNSEHWAELTQAVFLSFGFVVYSIPGLAMTPLVPFSVSRLDAAGGVMITASHNPKDDNGYKVYWENAIQIIPPNDKGISRAINDNLEPQVWGMTTIAHSPLIRPVPSDILAAYFTSMALDANSKSLNSPTPRLKFVNTSMHGVSDAYVSQAFRTAGLPPFVPVESQRLPDPEFPTVRFPNPEEKGALDIALRKATEEKAEYVLAQDPDADRFVAAERLKNGEWKVFSGDMLGIIFAARTLELYIASRKRLDKLAMIASTVSSKMLKAMAEKEGFKFVECLTGFKYIGNTALDLVKQGYEVPFGYEEAIGFMIGSEIRDKDGVAATVFFAKLAIELERRNTTVSKYLTSLYEKYGYFETRNSYYVCNSPPTIDAIFARLRNYEEHEEDIYRRYPREIGGLKITWLRDLTTGYDSGNPPTFLPDLPLSSGHMIQIEAESSSGLEIINLTLRTSGTEPKIKYYLEGQGKDLEFVRIILGQVVADLNARWMQAVENGLTWPEQS